MGERRRIAGFLELAQHLVVGEDLPRIRATECEQAAQQRRLVDPGQQQHVAGDGRFHERIEDVARPAGRLPHQRRGAGIGAVEQVSFKGPSERRPHLGEAPVRQMQALEAAGEALGQAAGEQQGRRTERHHLQPPSAPGVLVPQAFDGLRPVGGLLNLVQDEQRALAAGVVGQEPRRVPLLRDPFRAAQGRLVGAGEAMGQAGPLGDLRDQGGLAHLPRPGDDLEEPARLPQTVEQDGGLGPRVVLITHCSE